MAGDITTLKRKKTKAPKKKIAGAAGKTSYLLLDSDPLKPQKTQSGLGPSSMDTSSQLDGPGDAKVPKRFGSKKLASKFSSTIRNLPPPFAIIDHLVFLVKRSLTNSLTEFLKIFFIEISEEQIEDSRGSVPLSEMKLEYEKYCFLKHFSERQINTPKGAKKIGKYGFDFIKKRDNLT